MMGLATRAILACAIALVIGWQVNSTSVSTAMEEGEILSGGHLTQASVQKQHSAEGESQWEQYWEGTESGRPYAFLSEIQHYLEAPSEGPHKALLPLSTGDIIGFILTILVLFIAAGGGIGGGGAIIPLYLLFLGFNTRIAVALGNITIVGGALSNFVFNVPRRHAVFNRPLIDWDLILVMEPSTILGALIGGYLNKALPNWLTTVLLAVLLTFISYKLVMRGLISWEKESEEQRYSSNTQDGLDEPLLHDQREQDPGTPRLLQVTSRPITAGTPRSADHDAHSPLAYTGSLSRSLSFSFRGRDGVLLKRSLQDSRGLRHEVETEAAESEVPAGDAGLATLDEQRAEEAAPLDGVQRLCAPPDADRGSGRDQREPLLPSRTIGDTIVDSDFSSKQEIDARFSERLQVPPIKFGSLVVLTAVVAVSDYYKDRVRCGSLLYWLLVIAIVPPVLAVTMAARRYLLRKCRVKLEAGYVWREGDVEWNPVTTLTYPAFCSLAGLVAGMFGMGVAPDVASATSATMIVFTSASASIVFLSFGGIPTDYAVALFVLGIVFTMLGQVACYVLMRVLSRRSVIVFAMAALMLLSMVITYYEAVIGTIAAAQEHRIWRWGRFCQ